MTEGKRIFLNIAATYGRSLVSLFCGLFTSRWVLQSLGEVDFGLYGVVGGLTLFIAFFNTLLGGSISRFYAFALGRGKLCNGTGTADCTDWFNTAVLVHTVAPLVLMAIGYPLGEYAICHWLVIPAERIGDCIWVFRFVCLSCLVSMVNIPFTAMYTAKQNIAELTFYSLWQTVVNFLVAWYMVCHPGVWLLQYSALVCVAAMMPQVVICIRAFYAFPECRIVWSKLRQTGRIRELGTFAFWQMLGALGALLRGQGIAVLVNRFFGASANAAMTVGNQINSMTGMMSNALTGAFTPAITTAYGTGDIKKVCCMALRLSKMAVLLSFFVAIPLILELPQILALWLKNPPYYAQDFCLCFIGCFVVDCTTIGHMAAVHATGKVAFYQLVLGGGLVLTLPLAIVVLLCGGGIVGVCWSLFALAVFCAWGRPWFTKRMLNMSVREWAEKVMFPLCITLMLCFGWGHVVQACFPAVLLRIVITAIAVDALLVVLAVCLVLDSTERKILFDKLGMRRKT